MDIETMMEENPNMPKMEVYERIREKWGMSSINSVTHKRCVYFHRRMERKCFFLMKNEYAKHGSL